MSFPMILRRGRRVIRRETRAGRSILLGLCTTFVCAGSGLTPAAAQDPHGPGPVQHESKDEGPRGVSLHKEGALDGYTLLCPLMSLRTVLLDMDGEIVHEWKSALPPGNSVYLQDNGNILRAARIEDGGIFEGGGIGGMVQEYTWDGELVWEFSLADKWRHHHHDIEPLPNGNVLLIVWERKSYDKAIFAGRDPALMQSGEFWPDAVFEIRKLPPNDAEIVWEWHVWDHLIQDHDPKHDNHGDVQAHPERVDINADQTEKKPDADAQDAQDAQLRQLGYVAGDAKDGSGKKRNVRGADWLHTNGIDYNPELDQIVLSVPKLGEFWVIDHSTTTEEAKGSTGGRYGRGGDLLFRYGNPATMRATDDVGKRLFFQHDVQWIAAGLPGAGDLLLYNNGQGRPEGNFSTVDQLASPANPDGSYTLRPGVPTVAEMAWQYGQDEGDRFFSGFISGAQRLQNGNTLICEGAAGRIFEVTSAGEIVWDYRNEVGGDTPREDIGGHTGINPFALFRATRIPKDHPGLSALRDR